MFEERFAQQYRLGMKDQDIPIVWGSDLFAHSYINKLTRAFLYLTERCNLHCRGCYVGASRDAEAASLPFMMDAIHTTKELGAKSVTFMGGEPTVWKEIVPLMEFAGNEGLRVVLDTNGEPKAQKVLEKAVETVPNAIDFIRVNVSIDSHEENEHNLARGERDNWRHVIQTVNRARELGFVVSSTNTVTSNTVDRILDTLHFIEDLGVQEINLHVISYEGRATNYPELLVAPKIWLNTVEKIIAHGSFSHLNLRFPVVFGPSDPVKLSDTVLAGKRPEWVYRCVGEDNADRLGVRPNGSLHVCALVGFSGFQGFRVTEEGNIVTLADSTTRKGMNLQPVSEVELFRSHKQNPYAGCPATLATGERDKNLPADLIYLCRSVKITLPAKNNNNFDYFKQQYPDNPNLAVL